MKTVGVKIHASLALPSRSGLANEPGPGHYAWHSAQSIGTAATALYFTTADDAQRFVAQFPEMELADGTRSVAYTARVRRRLDHEP